jgi:uncharacterized protein (DUF1501 family)
MTSTHDSRVCCAEHARAGAGLPAIERGMPTPAGTGLSRRSFLLRSAGLALSVYGAGRLAGLPVFEEGIARAQAGGAGTVLVSVFLDGGADSLSILAPVGDPDYRRLRPSLALGDGGTAFSEDPRMTWHPAAAPLAALHAEGKVSVMPAVGYDHPDQSHFVSRHFWEVGATDAQLRSGWLGRVIDRIGTADNPLQGVSLGGSLGPSLAAARMPVAAVEAPEDFGFWAPGAWGPPADLALPAFADVGRALAGSRDPAVAQAAKAAAFAGGVRAALAPLGHDGKPTYTPQAVYPQSTEERFPRRLAGLAAMLGAGLPVRCATLSAPGAWDTHADQAGTLPDNLKITADSLYAFQRDLEARGIADRVLTLVWSEFGRRAEENGSGTDHGAAGIGFVIGTRASGRMIGEFPGLAQLDPQGNLRATSDFRGLYSALCADWFGVDPASVLGSGASVARPKILR